MWLICTLRRKVKDYCTCVSARRNLVLNSTLVNCSK
jgi:hypothetical protein